VGVDNFYVIDIISKCTLCIFVDSDNKVTTAFFKFLLNLIFVFEFVSS